LDGIREDNITIAFWIGVQIALDADGGLEFICKLAH